jgi:hypothetical protein
MSGEQRPITVLPAPRRGVYIRGPLLLLCDGLGNNPHASEDSVRALGPQPSLGANLGPLVAVLPVSARFQDPLSPPN